ncbi:Wzz/FepE/Etk N-terminal domain-containing protein [Dasania marina]|uniref:LPS O-antigen chain length determinant protein WzzB n=1 Tax=Dasania marina TaxID=471499 RepID=UPI0030DB2E99|tara:strand:- start:41069 stop:42166 length:1098 start_codon:yes stop_codon:yes gene_type:complete
MQASEQVIPQSQDEIDLFEMAVALWCRKGLIVIIAAVTVCLAIVYLVYTPRVYEAKVYLSEVQSADVAILNAANRYMSQPVESSGDSFSASQAIASVTNGAAFALLQKNLNSIAIATSYFKQDMEVVYRKLGRDESVNELVREKFLKSLAVVRPAKDDDFLTVAFQYTDPVLTAKWLNGYIKYVDKQTKQELLHAARDNKSLAIDEYHKQIDSLRSVYAQRLQDRLIRLEEAYNIAKKLGFNKPAASNAGNKTLFGNLDESLMYVRGYEVLQAELDALKSRSHRDPFIPEIRPIQERINYLKSISYDENALKIVSVDSWAMEPERSVKPNKILIILLAGLVGGMLGILVALIKWAIDNRKKALLQ